MGTDQQYPALEGVLFIGNIKLPSFFQSRTDTADTRLLPRYYEDLDGVFSKRLRRGRLLAARITVHPEHLRAQYRATS
jgi:hypothetical protein